MKRANKKLNRRRYYLNAKVRKFARVSAKLKTVYVPYLMEPTEKQQHYFDLLKQEYGYAIQTEIPEQ